MSDKPAISLCMIAKDEEQFLEQCIRSVLPIVSETIVLDTGSKDNTVAIARSLGAKVIHRAWTGDFAEARNVSLQYASGDWILVLDADERIAERDLPDLAALTRDRSICWEFLQRHYSNDHRLSNYFPVRGEHPECEVGHAGYFESNLVRLFPNREGLHYRGKVHELVEHSIVDLGKQTIKRTDIRIHHYGHTEAVKRAKNKGTLYTPLGQAKVQQNPNDWKNQFELGVEYNNNRLYEKSEQAFKRAAELNGAYISTFINLGYVQCELGKLDAAIQTLKRALTIDPGSAEAWCNLGVVFMRAKDFRASEAALRRAIAANELYVNAYNNLSILFAQMGRLSESAQILKRMEEIFPGSSLAKEQLSKLYVAAEALRRAGPAS
ncbi:MAG: glycosyltransferase [Bdellovibrionota bacterium]